MHQSFPTELSSGLRWYGRTLKSVLAMLPWHTWRIVAVSLISQVSTIVAFVLPLKVIIMLGSPKIPRYFPESFKEFPRDELIYGLSAIALTFYVVHLVAEKLSSRYLENFTLLLIERAGKIKTLANQNELARSACEAIVGSLTGIVFFALVCSLLGFLYPNLLIVLVTFVASAMTITFLLGRGSQRTYEYLNQSLDAYLGGTYALGFLCMFVFVVADYLLPIDPPGLIYALFGFVMGRQLLSGVNTSIRTITKIYKKRVRVDSLFFHGHLTQSETPMEMKFWALLEPDARTRWLREVVESATKAPFDHIDSEWHQTGMRGVASFAVTAYNDEPGDPEAERLLVRIFDTNRSSQAASEATLLELAKPPELANSLRAITEVGSYHVHLLDGLPETSKPVTDPAKTSRSLNLQLLSYQPDNSLVELYARTHPFLWQRITPTLVSRLRVAAGSTQTEALDRFERELPAIQNVIAGLPLAIHLPRVAMEDVYLDPEAGLRLNAWTNWRIEPLGAGWTLKSASDREASEEAIAAAAHERTEFLQVDLEAVALVSRIAQLETLYLSQKLSQALTVLPAIDKQLDLLGQTTGPRNEKQMRLRG